MVGEPRFWLAVVAAAAMGMAGGYCKGHHDADQSATVADQAKQIRELKAARDEYQRRTTAQQENADHAAKERDQARADAAAAATAADGLRKQVDRLVELARHPAATPGGPSTGDALGLLADVLGRADQRAGELAEYADRARIAGQQCERDYDALTIGSSASRN